MTRHKYILEPYKGPESRFTCPSCGKLREFVRYIDSDTGQHIAPEVGRCNREDSCGYHFTPSEYFSHNSIRTDHSISPVMPKPEKEPSFIDTDILERTLTGYKSNAFVQFLIDRFGKEAASTAINEYKIGSSKKWGGATIFWQIDKAGRVRTGKIMQYDNQGKRVKEPYNKITWVHSELNIEDFVLSQCLFGEHIVNKYVDKPVCLVESEKSAIIASIAMPDYIWIATGGKHGARWSDPTSFAKLNGRDVILFPDLGAFDEWEAKAENLSRVANISVSTILEKYADEEAKTNGFDIADFILDQNFACIVANEASQGTGSVSGSTVGILDGGLATLGNVHSSTAMGGITFSPMVFETKEELARFTEENGTENLTKAQMIQVGDYFARLNPSYTQFMKAFDLEYGEPVPLKAVPF